jgi:hypothetical protein
MKISVEQGTCEVNQVDLLLDTDDIKVLEIGTEDKYPEMGSYSSGHWLSIWPANWQEAGNFKVTKVLFEGLEGSFWHQFQDSSRYSIYVILMKYLPRTTIWRK